MNRLLLIILVLLCVPFSFALVSVSHMGYHPDSVKTVTVYTHAPSGTFIINGGAYSGTLTRPTDLQGNPVNCQGNNPCLVGDFSSFKTPGTYTITATTDTTESSHPFTISPAVYKAGLGVFNDFFDAQRQQGSSFHADFNTFLTPAFQQMADGSYIATPHQIATTLMRLGSAYRRNPQAFDSRMIATLKSHVAYLEGLQDAVIAQDPSGFRLDETYAPQNIFIPGPTNLTSLQIYDSGGKPLQVLPVRSLCGNLTGDAYASCISTAASVYKCQADEPCLNITYIGGRGKVVGMNGGPAVSRGWYYEWSCYPDMDLQAGTFNAQVNPCMIFNTSRDYHDTAVALAGYTEAIPAIYSADPASAQEIYARAVRTQQFIKQSYNLGSEADAAAFYGTASFLLYDMSGDVQYLTDAYNVRNIVSRQLVADQVHGNEFYWQEYVRHQNALTQSGMTYLLGNVDPASVFTGQIIGDYWAGNDPMAISKSGERVYQVYRDFGYMNSRNQLAESIFASKALDLAGGPSYAAEVADQQIAWVTGNNGVQTDTATKNLQSLSFIFGIGTNPQQFHSRLLMNTGYSAATHGQVIGMRDMSYTFKDPATGQFFGLDGMATVLGNTFGAHGNLWHGEQQTQWMIPQTFKNGKAYIPGWVNGAYLLPDGDDIYNYNDDRNNFLFTETEDTTVATAVEAFAYEDARLNHVTPMSMPLFGSTPPIPPNSGANTTNNTNSTAPINATLNIGSVPYGANITLNGLWRGITPALGQYQTYTVDPGTYTLVLTDDGYQIFTQVFAVVAGDNKTIIATLTPAVNTTNPSPNTTASGGKVSFVGTPTMTNVSTNSKGESSMYETGVAVFTAKFNQTATITWYVNGQLNRTVQAKEDTFSWNPGVLYTDKVKPATVQVFGNGQTNASFNLYVSNALNPYWEITTGTTDTLHVFANTSAGSFSKVTATLVSPAGASTVELRFESQNAETDWKTIPALTDMAEGETVVRAITTYNNVTGVNTTYAVGGNVAHFRQPAYNGGGGGGGYSGSLPYTPILAKASYGTALPEFIYATFSNDTIKRGDSVDLSIDAKDDQEVTGVFAGLTDDNGTLTYIPLHLTKGAAGYGTWMVTLNNYPPGKHTLVEVNVTDNDGNSIIAPVSDRGFYVIGDNVLSSERLLLVYAILDKSSVNPGDMVTIRLDARDFLGITAVNATLKSKDDTIIVPLSLVSGGPQYGTWEGKAKLTQSDATYALTSVMLTNGNESREARVYAQKVYVKYVKPAESSAAPQTVIERAGIAQVLKHPVTPLIIGLIGMGLAMLIVSSMTFLRTEK